ncbi:MAG: TolC family protein [Candidatus Marinimicrobia bacterium]|nr:TolC family protein [Candidatus Neomarinimicrobiota bacterium]
MIRKYNVVYPLMIKTIFFSLIICQLYGQSVYNLSDCLEIASKNNPSLKISRLWVESAQSGKQGSWSNILPSVNYSMTRSTQKSYYSPQYDWDIPTQEFYSGVVSLSQNIFDGGQWRNQMRASDNNYWSSQLAEQNNRITIALNVKKTFYQYLEDLQLLEVAKQSNELAKQQMELVEHQYEIEAVARTDLLKQKVRLGNSKVEFLNQQVAVKNSLNQLSNIMGIGLGSDFVVVDTPEDLEIIESFQHYWEIVQANNPTLMVKKSQIKGAELSLKISMGALYPSLSTSLSYDADGDGINYLFSDFKDNWRFQTRLTLSYPIFTGLLRKNQIEQAKIDFKIQNEEYRDIFNNLEVQLDLIILQLNNLQTILPIFETTKVSAEEDLRLAQKRYNLGAATIFDVLDAQLSVTRANSSLVRAVYDEKILRAELKALLGEI